MAFKGSPYKGNQELQIAANVASPSHAKVESGGYIQSSPLFGRPPRLPQARATSTVRLSPLDAPPIPDFLAAPQLLPIANEAYARSPSIPSRSPIGHVGNLWEMRRSAPSTIGERMMAELALPNPAWRSLTASAEPPSPRREPHRDVRVRRARRSADMSFSSCGASMKSGVRGSNSTSSLCSLAAAKQMEESSAGKTVATCAYFSADHAAASQPSSLVRCASMPPTGTAKADDSATMQAKSRAIAALQRLFFDEMAKNGGTDASGAAAAALRRLSEVPMTDPFLTESSSLANTSAASAAPTEEASAPLASDRRGDDEAHQRNAAEGDALVRQAAALNSRPVIPRRPSSSVDSRRRRPVGCVRSSVPVQG
jgi:hypothetical protein